ncbi:MULTISPECIES: hypothetical protein [unclassified Ensifer]|uniref:hypothetical protein n=1 Tax=unclassified Ensifer TaxID=2633371 RepID=UPI000709FD48|nr:MULTISPECIES: hypothetical protein [unclassified Ensifer]KQW33520.1 hypothetical protein ASD02_18930 [Ensifer sp. Root1252]KRC78694.1 hypothetical protein ASE32_26900 [Ensifer sp. Root231]KRD02597.1 hypothetical protein ASE47_19990 [Ensifer sp. Root258]
MKAKAVLRFMKEQQFGFDRDKLEEVPAALAPDKVTSGRDQTVNFLDEDGVPAHDVLWIPPKRSTGTRQPTPRTQGHSRGYLVDPGTERAVGFESTHELACALMLLANRAVVDIEDQPPEVEYMGADGKVHGHTFDYRATLRSGATTAIAVKPSHLVEKTGIRDVLKRVRPVLNGFADTAILLTDEQLTKARAWNAKNILRARRCRNDSDCNEVRDFLQGVHGTINVYDLGQRFGDFPSAMNAIWCLIYERTLVQNKPGNKLCDAPDVHVAQRPAELLGRPPQVAKSTVEKVR